MVRVSCGVVWCWKKRIACAECRQVAAATAPDKFKSNFPPALTSSLLRLFNSSLFTLHLGRDPAARDAHSVEGPISKAMMSSQVRGLISFLTFCLLFCWIEFQRCQKMVTSLCALRQKETPSAHDQRLTRPGSASRGIGTGAIVDLVDLVDLGTPEGGSSAALLGPD
jgi:hypothetical protein